MFVGFFVGVLVDLRVGVFDGFVVGVSVGVLVTLGGCVFVALTVGLSVSVSVGICAASASRKEPIPRKKSNAMGSMTASK